MKKENSLFKNNNYLIIITSIILILVFTQQNTAYADNIHTIISKGGGDAVITKNLRISECHVTATLNIDSISHGGTIRNNPDGTFYPGDAYSYSSSATSSSDGRGCKYFKVCPTSATCAAYIDEYSKEMEFSVLTKGIGDSGTIEISPNGKTEDDTIKKEAYAARYVCIKAIKWNCGWGVIKAAAVFSPNVLNPKIQLEITEEKIKDTDGFEYGNNDGTYYLDDAINIVTNPKFKWKNDRIGTITTETESTTSTLTEEYQYRCKKKVCAHTAEHNAILPWHHTFDYDSGHKIWNSTNVADIKEHTINLESKMYNLNRLVTDATIQKNYEIIIDESNPKYTLYPYTYVLDGKKYSYQDRTALVVHYFGNEGKDGEINTQQRSKINKLYGIVTGLNPTTGYTILDAKNEWGGAEKTIMDDSFQVSSITNTAMFTKAGYGKVFVTNTINEPIYRYTNMTQYPAIAAIDFAGKDTWLENDFYQYPLSQLIMNMTIQAVDSEGIKTENTPVSITVKPNENVKEIWNIDRYMYEKTLYDTLDEGFAQIVMNDAPPTTIKVEGIGVATAKVIQSTLLFPFYFSQIDEKHT